MDTHTVPPTTLCLSPPNPGGVAGQSKAAPVQVCQCHISLPVQSMPGWPSGRCLSQAPCPGYLFWPSHGWDTTAWRHGMGHPSRQSLVKDSGQSPGESLAHVWVWVGRWRVRPQEVRQGCGTYSESEVSACPVPTWRLMAMPLSWSRDCSLRTFFTVTPESEGERTPSFVPREVVLDETVLWL